MPKSEDCHPEQRPQAEVEGSWRSSHWPFLILIAALAFILAAIFGNLPILLFVAAGLVIIFRFSYRTFLRPYLRVLRLRRTRDARAFREAAKLPPR